MENQANKLHELVGNNATKKNSRTKFVAITSGKGGVGKST
ncbi:MAG: ATP-binding protein, partial [Sulfurospirillaceae bacterium]|nr:ATP-binding protein [Sulfurospirillaceae bacterium]